MVEFTDEYIEWEGKFRKQFGYGIPLMMIPQVETTEGMIASIKKCLDAKKDLLQEIYKWEISPDIHY